jgi:hypothetical protein
LKIGEQSGFVDRKKKEKDVLVAPFTLHPPSVEGAFLQSVRPESLKTAKNT